MKILLLTNSYPYHGEQFLKTELCLKKRDIILWTLFEVESDKFNFSIYSYFRALVSALKQIFKMRNSEIEVFKSKNLFNILKLMKFTYSSELRFDVLNRWMLKNYNSDNSICVYSYWMYEAAYIGARLKCQFPKCRFITRCHGYDLYGERHRNGYLPYRTFILENADLICPISENGRNYLNETYDNKYEKKIKVCRLGTIKQFDDNNDRKTTSDEILVVSCSSLSAVKRVHLIAKALVLFREKIRWVHFGDGVLKSDVEKICKDLPPNVSVVLKGQVSNDEIQRFYSQFIIHAFINVSESEGIPVSIMEAISYGIPVVATNVGGTSEIVYHDDNGLLLNKNFTSIELREAILKVKTNLNYFSMNARRIWKEKYDANKNYDYFYSLIEKWEDL